MDKKIVGLQERVRTELQLKEKERCTLENEALKLNKQNSEVFYNESF